MSQYTLPATGLACDMNAGAASAATQRVILATDQPAIPAGHDVTGVLSGRKVVATAGSRVALASSTAAKSVLICAETDNTGIVVVGSASGVIADLATREGIPLSAGDAISLRCDNLADIGLDSTVSGDGVTFLAET